MSECQHYESRSIDRPLGDADRKALRALSSRAQITTTSFTNHYEWGDFKGDPRQLVERGRLNAFLLDVDWVEVWETGEHLVVDMCRDEVEEGYSDWDSGWVWQLAIGLTEDLPDGETRRI